MNKDKTKKIKADVDKLLQENSMLQARLKYGR